MKILWISHLIPFPPKAGVLIRSYNLVRELGERHDLHLLAMNQPRLLLDYFPSEGEGIAESKKILSSFVDRIWIEPIPAEKNKLSRLWLLISSFFLPDSYTNRWLYSSRMKRMLKTILSEETYDLIHLDTISLDYLRPMLPPDTPIVLDHHNVESHMMGRRAEKEPNQLKRIYLKREHKKLHRYERSVISEYDANIVCSTDDAERLFTLSPRATVEVIPNGIQLSNRVRERNPESGRLLFIGGLQWYPNVSAVLDFVENIAPLLRADGIQFQLDIVGSNPPRSITEATKDFDDINLHGFVDDIQQFYAHATVFVCPINDGGGTKLKVLDAMANGVPLVGYPLSCEGIEVTDGKNVLLADTPEAFSAAIAELLNDKSKAYSIGAAGRKLIKEKYDYRVIGSNLDALYQRICSYSENC